MGGPEGGPGAKGGGPGGAGPGEFKLDLGKMQPQQTQDEIRAGGNYATVSGSFKGSCTGALRVDVIDRTPGNAPKGPITIAPQTSTEAFSVLIPKGQFVAVSALCDADKDGFITGGSDDLASNGVEIGEVKTDQEGFTIVLESAGDGNKGPPGKGGKGGPPGKGGKGGSPGKGSKGGSPPGGGPPPDGGPPPVGGPPPDGGPPPGE